MMAGTLGDDDEVLQGEGQIIREYFLPLTGGLVAARGLADDCAVLAPPSGMDLVMTTDSLIEGVHFFPGDTPGFKALAVNISDLVAKGATPLAYLLTLALSAPPTRSFMARLTADLKRAQDAFGCRLIGGDTDRTPGLMTLTIAAFGYLPHGTAIGRDGARPGDRICVAGTIGDSGLGLRLRHDPACFAAAGLDDASRHALVRAYEEPRPSLAVGPLVRQFASAAIDISDGLVKDLGRLTATSGVGGRVAARRVPVSDAARQLIARGATSMAELLTSGEDYQVLMTVAPEDITALAVAAQAAQVAMSEIGEIVEGSGVVVLDGDGRPLQLDVTGWDHF
ncbi:MAG: thiamine-phosphate kinase [Hyphomicrobiaceae bacterium]|nr:thiamine-phosphate kinase [Hyphomicrobiaceae bacterium]